jgi:hypothetical protein
MEIEPNSFLKGTLERNMRMQLIAWISSGWSLDIVGVSKEKILQYRTVKYSAATVP